MVAFYLDDDHPESINVRHLGWAPGSGVFCVYYLGRSPSEAVPVRLSQVLVDVD